MTTRTARCPSCHRLMRRSNHANAAYWGLLREISSRLTPAGNSYSADAWHEFFKGLFLDADDLALPDGTTLIIHHGTSDLDAEEFSEYLAKVEAWSAEKGVYLEARD